MKIFSRVCAEFHDAKGNVLFAITPATRLSFVDAPESIKQDLLFDLLVREGSLEVTKEGKNVALENEPMAGHDATGKSIEAAEKVEAKTAKGKGTGAKNQATGTREQASGNEAATSDAAADPKAADAK